MEINTLSIITGIIGIIFSIGFAVYFTIDSVNEENT